MRWGPEHTCGQHSAWDHSISPHHAFNSGDCLFAWAQPFTNTQVFLSPVGSWQCRERRPEASAALLRSVHRYPCNGVGVPVTVELFTYYLNHALESCNVSQHDFDDPGNAESGSPKPIRRCSAVCTATPAARWGCPVTLLPQSGITNL